MCRREISHSQSSFATTWVLQLRGRTTTPPICISGDCSFLLQNFYKPEHAGNFMMHLLVADVAAWWRHVENAQLVAKYGVRAESPDDRPWGMRDFTIADPTGVLWRIAQNTR